MSLSFALGLVLVADAPTIVVDAGALALPQVQTEQLHGELMTRLVESGHAVGSTGAITVRLTGGGRRVHVEVQHGRRSWQRDVDGEGALLRLATIHAALDLLAGVDVVAEPDPALASAPERSLVIEADSDAAAWVPEVIAALVDAGNVVKPSAEGAGYRVCVATREARPTLAVVRSADPCPQGVPSERVASDVVVALADARAQPVPADPEPTPIATPPAEPVPPPIEPTPIVGSSSPRASRRGTWSGALGVGAGAQGRMKYPEALLLVHGDARHSSGALLSLRVELAPSVNRREQLSVVDTFVTAGTGYAFVPTKRLRVELLATAGLLVHGYSYEGTPGASGPDFTASLPFTLAIGLTPRLELGMTVVGGVSTRVRKHERDGERIWKRDRFRVGGLLSLRVLLGRKPQRAKVAARA